MRVSFVLQVGHLLYAENPKKLPPCHLSPLCISLVCPTTALPACLDSLGTDLGKQHIFLAGSFCCNEATVCQWVSQKTWGCYCSGVLSCYLSILDFTWLSVNQLKAHCRGMRLQWQLSLLCPLRRDVAAVKYGLVSVLSMQLTPYNDPWSITGSSCASSCVGRAARWEGSVSNGLRGLTGSGLVL